MNYSINDLRRLAKSKEYQEYKKENRKHHILWEKIYGRRKDLWLTQAALSKKSWVAQNKISQMESGTYWEPWSDILWRLSEALQIPNEYLSYDSISRKTVEMYNYIFQQLDETPDIMQFMKLPYFIDLSCIEKKLQQISNFEYIRWNYGPFDRVVYDYQKLFSFKNEKGVDHMSYVYLSLTEQEIIDETLNNIPKDNWDELKKLSYDTQPMKKLWVCIWDNKCMWEVLKLYE